MRNPKKNQLGDRELDIMQVLWKLDGATIGEVHRALLEQGEEVAYTTIQTMLNRLEAKGVIKRRLEETTYHYYPDLKKSEVIKRAVKRLTGRFFKDSAEALIVHLVKENLKDEQLDKIQTLIDEQRHKGAK